ncbi:hypothetical protein CP532_6630 [Ophiocordyceps camponoti-leonardi (nom. inval.)]|nr:hypothetical protein CP532_6630 [Ophiocordyceps camponoti-leonardi (nom. inval.)]
MAVEKISPYEGKGSEAEIKTYQVIVGSLMGELANPDPQYLSAAVQVLQYPNHTEDLSVAFNRRNDEIVAMSDSSFGDNADRKSTHGFVIRVFGGMTPMGTPLDVPQPRLCFSQIDHMYASDGQQFF